MSHRSLNIFPLNTRVKIPTDARLMLNYVPCQDIENVRPLPLQSRIGDGWERRSMRSLESVKHGLQRSPLFVSCTAGHVHHNPVHQVVLSFCFDESATEDLFVRS